MATKPPRKSGEPLIREIDYTVDSNGCFVWNWAVHRKGYASIRVGQKSQKAHRIAYEKANGPIAGGQMVRHLCGNPSCVNPEHLQAGTTAENARDMVKAGTQGHQKLTVEDAVKIRRLFAQGDFSYAELGRQFGVSWGTIRNIILKYTFPDSSYEPPSETEWRAAGKRNQVAARHQDVIHEGTASRPTLRSINEPPPTGKVKQQQRLQEQETRNQGKRPKHTPGEPLVTDNDWVLDPASGCHNWKWRKPTQRPSVSIKGKQHLAYRVMWETHYGPIHKGLHILHRCNNHRCVNVDHLYMGNHSDNMRDTVRAGNHATQKLTWKDAGTIRDEYMPSVNTCKQLATKYGVSETEIRDIIANKVFIDLEYVSKSPGASVNRKLMMEDATTIRQRHRGERITMSELGRQYQVHQSTIGDIVHNRTYFDPDYIPPNPDEIPMWKLSLNDVEVILSEFGKSVSNAKLARKFGVHPSRIGQILREHDLLPNDKSC